MNACTRPDRYPVKRMIDFTAILKGTSLYSTLDLKRAFHQISVHPEDVEKTAVITPFGLFEYTAMTFGLKNAAQTFQRYADAALGDLPFVFVYIDDSLIASSFWEEHLKNLKIVLERLQIFGLQLNLEKCVLEQPKVSFLGYCICEQGYRPLENKVEAIANFPKPQNVDQLRKFLGMINFYRESIPRAAHAQRHLNKYLKNAKKKDKTPILWDEQAEEAFEICKKKLSEVALLAFPDDEADLRLVTDASDMAMGAALEQLEKGIWKPLAFFSRKFTPAQSKYSTYDRELMAIVEAVKHFLYYLEGRPFEVCTDHKPIIYSQQVSHDKAPAIRTRKITFLSQFDIKYTHIEGEGNSVADALSRIETTSVSSLSISPNNPEMGEEVDSDPDELRIETVSVASLSISSQDPIIATLRFPTVFDAKTLSQHQKDDPELKTILENSDHPLKLQKFTWDSGDIIYCNLQELNIRPYLPLALRKQIIKLYHSQSHPSARVTDRLIRKHHIWPHLTRDIAKYCRTCLPCQTSKISRKNKTKPAQFDTPDARFQHVHIDIVGLLLPSNGHRC